MACALFARSTSSTANPPTLPRSKSDTAGTESRSSERMPKSASIRPTRGDRRIMPRPTAATISGPVGGRTSVFSSALSQYRSLKGGPLVERWRHTAAWLMRFGAFDAQKRRRRDHTRIECMVLAAEKPEHALHVITRFREGRDTPISVDGCLARVVRRDRQRHLPLVIREQPAQIRKSPAQIVLDVVGIADIEAARRLWNELHQPACVFRRARAGLEVRLDRDDRQGETWFQRVTWGEQRHLIGDFLLPWGKGGEGIGVELELGGGRRRARWGFGWAHAIGQCARRIADKAQHS